MSNKQNPYSIKLSKQERERYEKFAKDHGFQTLSKLIRKSLDTIIRSPSLVEPTEEFNFQNSFKEYEKGIQRSTKESYKFKISIEKRLDTLEEMLGELMSKQGFTKKDIKKAQKKDLSEEVIFE